MADNNGKNRMPASGATGGQARSNSATCAVNYTPESSHCQHFPEAMKVRPQWIVWKTEERDGKPTKVPYSPRSGFKALVNKPMTWGTFAAALEAYRNPENDYDGVGYVFSGTDGDFTGIDLDHCIDEDGNLEISAAEIVEALSSYTEISPSGRGLHVIVNGKLPDGGRRNGRIEMYDAGRYFTMTGNLWPGAPSTIENRQAELEALHKRIFQSKRVAEQPTPPPTGTDDTELLRRAMSAAKFSSLWRGDWSGYESQSEADLALCSILAQRTDDIAQIDRLFRQSGLYRDKWDERHYGDGRTYGQATIEKALEGKFQRLKISPEDAFTDVKQASPQNRASLQRFAESIADLDPISVEGWIGRAKQEAGISKTALREQVKEIQNRRLRKYTPTDDELRDQFLAQHPRTAYGLGEWRRYQAGHWPVVPDDQIRREISSVIEEAKANGVRLTANRLHSVEELTRVWVFARKEEWDNNPDLLVCANGTLHIPTMTLYEHSPDDRLTTALPFSYDPSAQCSTFLYAIRETIPDAENFLQEFAGYALTTDTSLETAVWFYGPPGSGKSTVIEGLLSMLGSRAGTLGLADVERSRFALTNIIGKTLLVATEQPSMYIRFTNLLNALISGEMISVDRKYRDPIDIVPHAKILWAMNDLPRVGDAGNGLFRRVKVIEFPPLPESKRDPRLKKIIKTEGAGILNWALKGLQRLRERGYFEVPKAVKDATDDFQHRNDKPKLFVEELCITGPEYKVQSSTLYRAYKLWCEANGYKAKSSTSVASDWKRLGFERYRSAGKTWWRGVGLLGE